MQESLNTYSLISASTSNLTLKIITQIFFFADARVLPASMTPDGTGRQIWLDNLRCTGTELQLVSCRRNAFGSHNCNHGEDVGVTCQQFIPGELCGHY